MVFIASYAETTKLCEFTDQDNFVCLKKCLRGKAAETVEALLISPNNLTRIMSVLKTHFGQPQFIVESMISKARNLSKVKDDVIQTFIDFGTAVRNVAETAKNLNCSDHLTNPQLLRDLESKLSTPACVQWYEYVAFDNTRTRNLILFAEWLEKKTEIMCQMYRPTYPSEYDKRNKGYDSRERNKFRRPGEHAMVVKEDDNQQKKDKQFEQKDFKQKKCSYCQKTGHAIQKCQKFKDADVNTKWTEVKDKRLCFACLNFGHGVPICRSKKICGTDGCEKFHHTLLHKSTPTDERRRSTENVNLMDSEENQAVKTANISYALHGEEKGKDSEYPDSKLRILPINPEGPNGTVNAFVLLDPGASCSLITESLAQRLGLKGNNIRLKLSGVNKVGVVRNSREVSFRVTTADGRISYDLVNVCTVDELPLPHQTIKPSLLKKYRHLQGLGIEPFSNGKPEILLGQDHGDLICSHEVRTGSHNAPIAVRTLLGWTLSGRKSTLSREEYNYCFHEDSIEKLDDLHAMVKKDFELNAIGVKIFDVKTRSTEDERSQVIMDKTMRDIGGQWETSLLWKVGDIPRSDGYQNAFNRLRSMEKRWTTIRSLEKDT